MRHALAMTLIATVLPVAVTSGVGAARPAVVATTGDPTTAACRLPHDVRVRDLARGQGTAADLTGSERRSALTRATDSVPRRATTDPTLWLDACRRPYYADPAVPPRQRAAALRRPIQADPIAPLAQTFTLHSKPGSLKTIYLDFDGGLLEGPNIWFQRDQQVRGYSIDDDPTTFTDQELVAIQHTWAIVAEDYAPFEVDVTTQLPSPGQLGRATLSDRTYGSYVAITDTNSVRETCGLCGGIAYVGIHSSGDDRNRFLSPAWAFTDGATTRPEYLAEAISHEVGHNMGLHHDGVTDASGTTVEYYLGDDPWAPIMGIGSGQPLTQWSRGSYRGATNTENDVAILAGILGRRQDDYPDTVGSSTVVLRNGAPVRGVIEARDDVDVFSFEGANALLVRARLLAMKGDTDLELRLYDETGTLLATANDPLIRRGVAQADGQEADLRFDLPATFGRYFLAVDSVGVGDGTSPATYDDYGSLGGYEVTLVTTQPDGPATATAVPLPDARIGDPYLRPTVGVSRGAAPITVTASALPPGLSLDERGSLRGTPTALGRFSFTVTVTDGDRQSVTVPTTLEVVKRSTPPVRVTTTSVENLSTKRYEGVQLKAAGGDPDDRRFSAIGLPPGFTMQPDGYVEGRPTRPGRVTAEVTVRSGGDAETEEVSDTRPVTFVISGPSRELRISSVRFPLGYAGISYQFTPLTFVGGTPPYVIGATGLPRGVLLSEDQVVGAPAATGAGTAVFTVRDADGTRVSARADWVVRRYRPVRFLTARLPTLTSGQTHTVRISIAGGAAPFDWFGAGKVPGMALVFSSSSRTVILRGTPTRPGRYTVSIDVADRSRRGISRTFRVRVR